eukprot:11092737-Lingulodinium_polyedra.AAC.1
MGPVDWNRMLRGGEKENQLPFRATVAVHLGGHAAPAVRSRVDCQWCRPLRGGRPWRRVRVEAAG